MWNSLFLVAGLTLLCTSFAIDVDYDSNAMIIDGERKLIFSGAIHYPRSTPEVSTFFPVNLLNLTNVFILEMFCYYMKLMCCCSPYRCGPTSYRNLKMADLMQSSPIFSGTLMSLAAVK